MRNPFRWRRILGTVVLFSTCAWMFSITPMAGHQAALRQVEPKLLRGCDPDGAAAPPPRIISRANGGTVKFDGDVRNYTLEIPKNSILIPGTPPEETPDVSFQIVGFPGDSAGVTITASHAGTRARIHNLQFSPTAKLKMSFKGCDQAGKTNVVVLRREAVGSPAEDAGKPHYPWDNVPPWLNSVHVERGDLSAYALAVP